MDEEKNFEKGCISPCLTCPNCDAHPDNIWYDNEEVNYWGHFRDAWCMTCNAHWCEISESDFDSDEDE